MAEEVKCPNILQFDKLQQKYVYCDHVFLVDGSNRGKVVSCPECGGEVRLGEIDISRDDTFLFDEPAAETSNLASDGLLDLAETPSSQTSQTGLASPFHPTDHDPDGGLEVLGDVLEPARAANLPTPTLPSSQHGTSLRMGSFCPSCGGPLAYAEIMCNACGFHKKLQRRIRIGVNEDAQDKPSGFQLWLQNSLTEGTSVQGVLLLAGALLFGILLLVAVVTFVAYRWWALIFLPMLAFVAILTLSLVANGTQAQETGVSGWAQRSLWGMVLSLLRLTRWQLSGWPPGRTVVKTIRDPAFDDDALLELEGLDECRVLDLERSNITDVALGYLTAFPQLRFIVLRKTQASNEAIRRLQRAIPAAWIWN